MHLSCPFLAHLIHLNQMCYCHRKLVNLSIFYVFLCMRGRICEAVRGRERPCSPDWLGQISKPMRGARPLTASHGLSLLSCDLSEPIRGARPLTASHGLTNSASHTQKYIENAHAHGLSDL